MQLQTDKAMDSSLPDESCFDLVDEFLRTSDISLMPAIFAVLGADSDIYEASRGEEILATILNLLLDGLNLNDANAVFASLDACPPSVADQAYELLLVAICPEGSLAAASSLDDAAVLCFALLLGVSGKENAIVPFLRDAGAGRTSLYFFRTAAAIVDRFAAATKKEAFEPKLIIWDLDDTLWLGTLAEGDQPIINERRAAFVRTFNRHGIVSAICSKNDPTIARAKLEAFGLWGEFVFPRIAFVPKGQVVKQMIADMQLRPVNVLFIDDNPNNLHEVTQAVPGIHVIDARSPECDALLEQVAVRHAHIAKSRVAHYRILEAKADARQADELTDEDFLVQSDVHATSVFRMDNLDFADRIEELINRSNQLNYKESRVAPGEMSRYILDISCYHVLTAFVWDKYGYYGLVGAVVYDFQKKRIEHLAFSCRIMHMGVEQFLIDALRTIDPTVDLSHLCKPLPIEAVTAIKNAPFADTDVRARILAEEAPRDWSAIRLRVMADCQSGALHHYSRHRGAIDYDNRPRLFTLPMMETGEVTTQNFPPFLVYSTASDYAVWRWEERLPAGMDIDLACRCIERFVELVIAGDHRCLLLLPPEVAPLHMFNLHKNCDPVLMQKLHVIFNQRWRAAAGRYPERFTIIELAQVITDGEMQSHLHHYLPSTLKRITGMMDDWYDAANV